MLCSEERMRQLVRQFVRLCADTLPLGSPIYEFGSLQVPGQEGFADLRPLFPGKAYVGADMQCGPGVDLALDLHHVALPAETAQTVLLLDTLEHVEFPWKAAEELHRILKPNGVLIVSSVMNFHIHCYPHDYWRFTPEAFKSLLRHFDFSVVDSAGDPIFPHTVVGVACKGAMPERAVGDLLAGLGKWKQYWRNPFGNSLKGTIQYHMPPWMLEGCRHVRAAMGAYR